MGGQTGAGEKAGYYEAAMLGVGASGADGRTRAEGVLEKCERDGQAGIVVQAATVGCSLINCLIEVEGDRTLAVLVDGLGRVEHHAHLRGSPS